MNSYLIHKKSFTNYLIYIIHNSLTLFSLLLIYLMKITKNDVGNFFLKEFFWVNGLFKLELIHKMLESIKLSRTHRIPPELRS